MDRSYSDTDSETAIEGVELLANVELPTIESDTSCESDDDVADIVFSGNTWADEHPSLESSAGCQATTLETNHSEGISSEGPEGGDSNGFAPPYDANPARCRSSTESQVLDTQSMESPAATNANVGDSSDLALAIDDTDLNSLILRLQQGIVERSDSIGSRVFMDLPSPSELFSDASDDGRTEPVGLLEGAADADDAEDLATERRGAVTNEEDVNHTSSVFLHSMLQFQSPPELHPEVSSTLLSRPRPTMILDLRGNLGGQPSSSVRTAERAWPALPEGLMSPRLGLQTSTLQLEQDSIHGVPGSPNSSSDDDMEEREFNAWAQQRIQKSTKALTSASDKFGSHPFDQARAEVAAYPILEGASAVTKPPPAAIKVSTRSMFVSTKADLPPPSTSIKATGAADGRSVDIAGFSTARASSTWKTKEDTDALSDKSGVVISNTQMIHCTGKDEEKLLPLSCSSPPLIDALATNAAGGSHGQHGCVAATSTSTAGAAEATPIAVQTMMEPSAAGTAANEQLLSPSSPVPALQDGSDSCCIVADQPPVAAALCAKAAVLHMATHQPDTSSPSDTQAMHAKSVKGSRRETQELQTPVSMLPMAGSDLASSCSNFTIVAHLPEYSAIQVADALQLLLGLQSDPYSTIPEFSVVSVLLAPAALLPAAQTGLLLPDQGAVLLLAARPSGRVPADEMLAELDSYLQEAIPSMDATGTKPPPQLSVQSVAGWELFTAASAASKSNSSTLTALGKQQQDVVLTMAKGAGALADAEVLAACVLRMARTGLHLLGLQTAYLDAQQCHLVNRGSQLHPDCGSASILMVAAGAAGAVLNWKAELGPAGAVAAVTDPRSLHAQLQAHDAVFTCSYDASAALKELDLLFPGSPGDAGGSGCLDQQKPASLLLPPPAEASTWIQVGAGSVGDLVQALHTVQFCCAAGCTVDRLGRAALPGLTAGDATGKAHQLLVHLASPGCSTMLEAISSSLQQECSTNPHAHKPQLVIVDPTSDGADELKRSCSGPLAYQDPGKLHDAQSELPNVQLPAAGKVDLVAIAFHSSVAGAAAGYLGSFLAQAQAHCPLLQVLGVRQQQQLVAPAQQLLRVFTNPSSSSSSALAHGSCKHVKGPLLLAVAAAVDLQQFADNFATGAGWRAASSLAANMACLGSAFDFRVADNADCVVGVSRDHSGAEELLWKCFQEGQVVLDRSVYDGTLLPADALAPKWEDVRVKISELNRPMPTVCVLRKEALVHNHLDRLLALLTKDGFVIEQATTALLITGLAAALGCPGAQGQTVILLCLLRPNAVQRLQHLLSAPGLDTLGATACPTYDGAVEVRRMLEAQLLAPPAAPACTTLLVTQGTQQTTCLLIPPFKDGGTQWSCIGSAWRELHEDGFRLVGMSTMPTATFSKLRGLSKVAAQRDAAAQGPVVVLAMARQNAVVRCEMKLQDAVKASLDESRAGLRGVAAFACCCVSSRSAEAVAKQAFMHLIPC